MTAFDFATEGPTPIDMFLDGLADQERRVYECGARPGGGHLWQLVAEPGEKPWLSCEACPAVSDDLVGDSCVYLEESPYDLGGRGVDFSLALPLDAEPYTIPVDVRVEPDTLPAGPWGPAEVRTLIILITPREVTS